MGLVEEYYETQKKYQEYYSVLDHTLYGLCKRYPGHADKREITAKVRIIDSVYAAGLTRNTDDVDDVVELFHRRRRSLEKIIAAIRPMSGSLSTAKLATIMAEHGRLVAILRGVARDNRTLTSFASKYMHFHCRAVPIYDTRASKTVQFICRLEDIETDESLPGRGADEKYYWFCVAFFALYRRLRERGVQVTVKGLDRYLWYRER